VARAETDEDPAIVAELDAIEAELKALQARKEVWSDADKARSGVILSLDSDGAVNIARGLVREERTEDTAKQKRVRSGYPESVLRDLGAHRTAALRECLAASPAIAELALLEALVSMSFHAGRAGCVEITAREVSFEHLSDSVGESSAAKAFFVRRQKWASKMPEPEELWSWLQTLDAKARKELMGLCVAMTINALHGNEDAASPLARLLKLDMRSCWKPSDVMLGRLSKADILAAVTQAVSSEAARKLSDLKKPVMAERAAKLLGEAGWLPEALRVENPTAELAAE
jgi:ParB family chromosome partitioning protein